MRSNLKTESNSVTGSAGSASTSESNANRTASPLTPEITARHTRSPATMSHSMPVCARSTRTKWAACSPLTEALVSSQLIGNPTSSRHGATVSSKGVMAQYHFRKHFNCPGPPFLDPAAAPPRQPGPVSPPMLSRTDMERPANLEKRGTGNCVATACDRERLRQRDPPLLARLVICDSRDMAARGA